MKKLTKNRYIFIKGFFLLILLKYLHLNQLYADEDINYILKGPFAGSFYYTKSKPGNNGNVVKSHSPLLEIIENTLKVSTPHEMKGYDHYIIKHIVLDNKFNIISEKVFDPSKETPVSEHNIMGYIDKLYVLSVCNNHDTWVDVIKIKKP
jgi:superoxide reductase